MAASHAATKDVAAPDVGHVVDPKSDAGETDRQDRDHSKRDRASAPRSTQDGQEDKQKHSAPDNRDLGVTAGAATHLFGGGSCGA